MLKKGYKVMSTFFLSTLFLFTIHLTVVQADGISNKSGDIIITNSTSSSGITGHVGIYITPTTILHTSGWKTEPYPKLISESEWHDRYAQSKVVRPNSSTLGTKAANQAMTVFHTDTAIPYEVTPGVTDITETYCSELVWYSYYKAGLSYQVFYPGALISWKVPSIISPYHYTDTTNLQKNGFKMIDSEW